MLQLSDFTGLIDEYSLKVVAEKPKKGVAIAAVGSAMKTLITRLFAESGEPKQYAQILDVCHRIDEDENCIPDPDLEELVRFYRVKALNVLFQKLHDARLRTVHEEGGDTVAVTKEWRLAQHVAYWISQVEQKLPPTFSPEWLEQSDQPFALTIKEHIYDIAKNVYDWNVFAALLPSHLQARFDATKVSFPVPAGFTNDAEAEAYLRRLLQHHGILPEQAANWKNMTELLELPGFRVVLEHFGRRLWEQTKQDSEGSNP